MAQFEVVKQKFPNETTLHIYPCFKSHMERSNAQRVSTLTTTISPTFHSLNFSSHVIYVSNTSTYQTLYATKLDGKKWSKEKFKALIFQMEESLKIEVLEYWLFFNIEVFSDKRIIIIFSRKIYIITKLYNSGLLSRLEHWSLVLVWNMHFSYEADYFHCCVCIFNYNIYNFRVCLNWEIW